MDQAEGMEAQTVRSLDSGKGPEWRTQIREWIYMKARSGEEFTPHDLSNTLNLTGDQARSLPAVFHSAVVAGILVKVGTTKSTARLMDPSAWVGGEGTKKRRTSVYKGDPRIVIDPGKVTY
jgi:hypothetical protein